MYSLRWGCVLDRREGRNLREEVEGGRKESELGLRYIGLLIEFMEFEFVLGV